MISNSDRSTLTPPSATFAFADEQPVFDEADENECRLYAPIPFAVEAPIFEEDEEDEEDEEHDDEEEDEEGGEKEWISAGPKKEEKNISLLYCFILFTTFPWSLNMSYLDHPVQKQMPNSFTKQV